MTAENPADILARLFAVIESRKGGDADSSYTAKLLAGARRRSARSWARKRRK